MASRTEVTGIKDVDKMLSAIDKKLSRKFIQQGFTKAAKPLVTAAKQMAPSNTGLLKKSIGVKRARNKKLAMVLVMPIQSKRFQTGQTKTGKSTHRLVSKKKLSSGEVTKKETSRAYYAHFLAGTKFRKTKKRGGRGSITSRNYMTAAFQQTEGIVKGNAGEYVIQAALKEARKRGFQT